MNTSKSVSVPLSRLELQQRIGPGTVVDARDHRFVVRRLVDLESVLALDLDSRKEVILPVQELIPVVYGSDRSAPDLALLSDEEWDEAIARFEAVQAFLEQEDRTANDVDDIALKHQTSRATLYRWVKLFLTHGTVGALLRKRREDVRVGRLTERVEKLMEDVIVKHYLKREQKSIKACFKRLKRLCRRLKLEVPHFNTFYGRVKKLAADTVAKNRLGPRETNRQTPVEGSFPEGTTPYEVIQIDHTDVDIMLVDDIHRIPIGRPWITLAIEVFSRMVAGWYISFDPPGTLGTGICVTSAILPKAEFLNRLGVSYKWPCMGKPCVIHADNAREFRGNTLAMACQNHGITLQFRKLKKPRYGAHIERLLGTLATEIHGLAGTTFANTEARQDYDPKENATMTLTDFERWLANLILGDYHHRLHSAIDMPPIEKFRRGVLGDKDNPGTGILPIPADAERLRIDFLPLEYRTIQPSGVLIDNVYYYAEALQPWIGAREENSVRSSRKFLFRRDPRDISSILFFDPQLQRYFRIPYRNITQPAISLWELRAVTRFLKNQGKAAEDEAVIFAALDEMCRIEDQARDLTQQARRLQRRAERPGLAPPMTQTMAPAGASNTPPVDEDYDDDLEPAPFEEVERL